MLSAKSHQFYVGRTASFKLKQLGRVVQSTVGIANIPLLPYARRARPPTRACSHVPHPMISMARRIRTVLVVILALAGIQTAATCRGANGQLELAIVDDATDQPIAARVQLVDSRGRTRHPRKTIAWGDHFVVDGRTVLDLPPGMYRFVVERGHEYRDVSGHFLMRSAATDNRTVRLKRIVDMTEHGWWSGDLELYRPEIDADALMRSEDLHVAPLMTWSNSDASSPPKQLTVTNNRGRFVDNGAGVDARAGGQVSFFGLSEPLASFGTSIMDSVKTVHRAAGHVNIARPNSWELPIWLASRQVNSFSLLDGSIWRAGHMKQPPTGKPADRDFYPPPQGLGRWYTETYFKILNSGLRVSPVAGSGSGKSPNPVGYNRTYVYCGAKCSYESWWENLRAGRVMVTNGPLMIPHVNGELPGHVFQGDAGRKVTLSTSLQLHTRERIDYLEVIKNGEVAAEVRLDRANQGARIPDVEFRESGWMLIRTVTTAGVYRQAMTGPFYVQFPENPRRISRRAAEFFLDWTREAAERIDLPAGPDRDSVIRYYRATRKFWMERAKAANVD